MAKILVKSGYRKDTYHSIEKIGTDTYRLQYYYGFVMTGNMQQIEACIYSSLKSQCIKPRKADQLIKALRSA